MTHTAQRIKTLRKQAGLSQQELADKIGVLRETISNWERSNQTLSIYNAKKLSQFFQVSMDELLDNQRKNKWEDNLVKQN